MVFGQYGLQNAQPPTPMNRMADRCKNITLPQTSFAGGNYNSYDNFCSNLTHIYNVNYVRGN